ncbi:MAG: trigger factor [Candidatus Omnitrophota bacterium]
MKVDIQKLDKLKRKISVAISGDEFVNERNGIYKEIGKTLKVSGFRPGSAPLEVLEKQHGKVLKEEFLHKALPLYYERAIEQEKVQPAGLPRIQDVELLAGSLTFSAELEVRPQLEVNENDYKGIKIKDKNIEIKEDEIQKVLTNLKEGVKKVLKKDLSDDELAKWASFPDVAGFCNAIKIELSMEKLRERRRKIDSQISQHLLKTFTFELPKDEVDHYHKELIEREIHELRVRNIPDQDIEKYKKDIEEKLKPLAQDEVKLFYILEAIARKENIAVEQNVAEVVLGLLLSLAVYES